MSEESPLLPPKKIVSYAFIDANNLILGLKKSNMKLDYKKFYIFLKDKYRVKKDFLVFVPFKKHSPSLFRSISSSLVFLDAPMIRKKIEYEKRY